MKQIINIGAVVDDGSGDYLRRGGIKINENFDEIYDSLGDTEIIHPAGAWKLHKFLVNGNALTVKFGDAYVIDTNGGAVNITLPKGTAADYGKVIKLRDANGTWDKQPVRLVVQTGDTVKGDTGLIEMVRKYQDIELVYTSPSRFEYVPQKLVSGISFGNTPSVIREAWLAVEDERDFDVFARLNGEYNIEAVECYRRGNLLYYGAELNDFSDFGSVPPADAPVWAPSTTYAIDDVVKYGSDWYLCSNFHSSGPTFAGDSAYWTKQNNGDLYPLDGKTIRLRLPANVNDPVAVVTYLTDVSSFRTSYNKNTIKVMDINDVSVNDVAGQIKKLDFNGSTLILTLVDFGYPAHTQYNPQSIEVTVNGHELTHSLQAGTGDSSEGDYDFEPMQDGSGKWNTIMFNRLEPEDIVQVRWFDSVIGTLLSWDEGDDNIQTRADDRYLQTVYTFDRKNKIRYTNTDLPSAPSTEIIPDVESDIRWDEVTSLLESIYPVGSLYFNANNPNNPADYMGFGKWVRYGQGKAFVGWQDADNLGQYDPNFGYNNQWLDNLGQPIPAAGGTGGTKSVVLTSANIPELKSGVTSGERDETVLTEQYALVARPNSGDINLNGCQPDPDSSQPVLGFYDEEPIIVNAGVNPSGVSVIQPYITIHSWVRTE